MVTVVLGRWAGSGAWYGLLWADGLCVCPQHCLPHGAHETAEENGGAHAFDRNHHGAGKVCLSAGLFAWGIFFLNPFPFLLT